MDGRMITGNRSSTSVGVQGRSPTVNVINITRRPDGGIVNVEMKRQEGMNQSSATAASPLRGAVPINVYRQPPYAAPDQLSNVMSVQAPRKVSPNASVAAQLHNADSHLDWSCQHQQLFAARQRMPGVVSRSDQQHFPPSSNHIRPVVEQHMLYRQVNDAVLPQYAHVLPASDVHLMTNITAASSTAVPVPMEGANGSISYRPVQMGNDLPASVSLVGPRVDPKLGNVTPQLISRLPGLQYDVIPPRSDGPSEAERKVAKLTQQLENEMRLPVAQQGLSSLRQQTTDTLSQYRSPPPYYGPHITANTKMSMPPSNPVSNAVTAAGGADLDLVSKKAADVSLRQAVTSSSSGLTDVQQTPQPSVHHGSNLDVTAESYGRPVLSALLSNS